VGTNDVPPPPKKSGSTPWWIFALVIAGVAIIVAVIGLSCYKKRTAVNDPERLINYKNTKSEKNEFII
jgi:hypothetical protein